jgi:hypothetical protein
MTPGQKDSYNRWLRKEKGELWRDDRKVAKRLNYNLERLARTEINHAQREAMIQNAKIVPWVKGIKWNLSNKHPVPDICDDWAGDDVYGLGKGVYPPDSTPIDHPNGFCYLTDVLVSRDEFYKIAQEQFTRIL